MTNKNIFKDILFGLSVGDALGVPVEFMSRQTISKDPVTGMRAFGTHNQPAGTFSDDSALAFCLAEALTQDFSLQKIANNFAAWVNNNYWTPHGKVFDIGIATSQAISRINKGIQPELAGGFEEGDNGNGSLMRILPLITYTRNKPVDERYAITKQVSSITHGHIRSVIACFYYLEFARRLIAGADKFLIYKELQQSVTAYLFTQAILPKEINLFARLLTENIHDYPEEKIHSSGYVLHTLEASIWCLLTTNTYRDAVLKAVNLGTDTDTTGAVTGGLAGLLYGYENIPANWITQMARRHDIEDLANRFENFSN